MRHVYEGNETKIKMFPTPPRHKDAKVLSILETKFSNLSVNVDGEGDEF